MDINRAVALAATTRQTELRRVYAAAVARGAKNTGCTAEVERAYGTLRLLTLALVRLPDLALCAHLLDMVDEPSRRMSTIHTFGVEGLAACSARRRIG